MNMPCHALFYVILTSLLAFAPQAGAEFLDGRTMTVKIFTNGSEYTPSRTNAVVNSSPGAVELPKWGNLFSIDVQDVDDSHASIRISPLTNYTFSPTNRQYFRFSFTGQPTLPFTNVTIGAHNIDSTIPLAVSRVRLTNFLGENTIDFDARGLVFPTSNSFVRIDITTVPPEVPFLTIDVSQVRLCWRSQTDTDYQIQYSSEETTNAWVNLGSPVAGNGTTNCVNTEVVTPRRIYQVLTVP